MNTPSFFPIKMYISEAYFISPNAPTYFLGHVTDGEAVNKISINVQTKANEDSSLYLVELHTSIMPKLLSNGNDVFCLEVTYCSLIHIVDENLDEESLRKLLTVDVPQSLYEPLRAFVWTITTASGFPGIMMEDFDFAKRNSDSSLECESDYAPSNSGMPRTPTTNTLYS